MRIGITLFRLRREQIDGVVERAEALGFDSVWIPEHLVLPLAFGSRYPYAADGVPPIRPETPLLDPMVLLGHIGARTVRIRLGTNIYLAALRHPLHTARMAMTVDVLSGGRLILGVGVGWLAEEFEAAGIDFESRAARTRECIRALRVLWTEPEPAFHGKYFNFGPLKFEPKPVQRPCPPIILGGESPAALKRAAAVGDGWHGVGHTPASAAPQVERLHVLRRECDRATKPFEITVSHRGLTLDRDELRRYADAGVERVVVVPWQRGSEATARLDALAEAVF